MSTHCSLLQYLVKFLLALIVVQNHICHGGFDNTRTLKGFWEFLRGMLTHRTPWELLGEDVMHVGHVLFLSHRADAVDVGWNSALRK